MFSALDGNGSSITSDITSEMHFALNEEEISEMDKNDQFYTGKFVISKDTNSSPSTASISILLDGEEMYNTGKINCYSLDIKPFRVSISNKKEMIIKITCQHKGNPFVIGMVNKD